MNDKEKITKLLAEYTKKNHIMASVVILENYAEHLIANDIVPVVKCEKCVFSKYIEDSGNYKCTTTKGRFGVVKPDDFCSYGE